MSGRTLVALVLPLLFIVALSAAKPSAPPPRHVAAPAPRPPAVHHVVPWGSGGTHNPGGTAIAPTLHPNRLSHAVLKQMIPNNFALHAAVNGHTMVAQKLAARRHHHLFRPWVWGFFPVGVYGLAGRVVSVPSGNTLMVTNAAGLPTRVRLFGVVAPMAGEFSIASKNQLESEVGGRFVHVHQTGTDLDGAIVAKVFHAGSYVNRDQVVSGMAWYSMEDGFDLELARAEEGAQGSSTGLWSDPYLFAPWVAAADRHPTSKFPWTRFSIASAD